MDLNRMRQLAGITHTRSGLGESNQVGKTILQQMGGAGRISAMLGAKQINLLDNGISFTWPNKQRSKGNGVRITLDPSDTYSMEFFNGAKSVKKYTDVYNDQLVSIFEKQTGWFLSLGGGKKAPSGKKPGPETDPSNVSTSKVASTSKSTGGAFWTVSSMEGSFDSLDDAKKAWFAAGKPKTHGSSVWATEHNGHHTLQTVTLNPSMESKIDDMRKLLGLEEHCGCEDDDASEEEKPEFSQDQLDAMEAVQGYSVPFFARTKTSDGEQWFRATGTLKNGNFSGMMLDAGAAGRSSGRAKKSSLDAKWARSKWDEVDAADVPEKIKAALGESEEDYEGDELDEGQTYAKAQADIMTGLEKDGWKVKKTGPSGQPLKVPQAVSPNGDFKLFFKAQAIYKTHGDGDLGNARSLHLPDIRKGGYADFSAALSRWTGQDAKGNPLPKKGAVAVQPGDWDKAVAQVKSDPKHQITPDQYHQKHGECPNGYHFDDSTKRCVKAKGEARMKACPECAESMHYDEAKSTWECACGYSNSSNPADKDVKEALRLSGVNRYADHVLGKTSVPTELESIAAEVRQYTGPAHPEWKVWTPNEEVSEAQKSWACMECGKKFRTAAAAMKAQENGCPKCGGSDIDLDEQAEDRTDLWHPDKNVKNPGLPTDKHKAASPADKGAQLLKALKCPSGKEAKLVFGRPSCAPKA